MVALLVSKKIVIQSHKGEYTARFIRGGIDQLNINLIEAAVYIIDSNKKRKLTAYSNNRIKISFELPPKGLCIVEIAPNS